ncbi:unnamed protein product [Moneuplotes crassus]|uniref:Uncharacterized protein n=1 Tax=Euplotes crassus TaxID=5936 RepID=A0AAD1UJB2_EUPCR|nr:unnamed protein product [Moneuplotes crassus]
MSSASLPKTKRFKLQNSLCSRDDLVINIHDCESQDDPYFSYSPMKKLPTMFFAKAIKRTPSVSSGYSIRNEIGEDDLKECLTPENTYFKMKELADQSFQKRVDVLSEREGKPVVKREPKMVPQENKFIQRVPVSPQLLRDKNAIQENKNNAIKLVEITSKDFKPIKLTSKIRESFISKVQASARDSSRSNPSQTDATTETRTNLPDIKLKSKVFFDSKLKPIKINSKIVSPQKHSVERLTKGIKKELRDLDEETHRDSELKRMITNKAIIQSTSHKKLPDSVSSLEMRSPYIKKSILKICKNKSIKNFAERNTRLLNSSKTPLGVRYSSINELSSKLTSYV